MKQRLFFLFCLTFLFSIACTAQEVGKIYSKADAKNTFGAVKDSVIFSADDLRKIITGTEKFVMMKIVNGKVILLGDGRKVLYPADTKVDSKDIFSFCSKSKVLELLKLSDSATLSFEVRQYWYTITYGDETIEEMASCPPWCL